MSTRLLEYIWKFLRENDCERADNITREIMCTICERILVDPCIASCGCRYCLACITGYLNGEQRFCPGNGYDCKEVLMRLRDLGHPDYASNQKIAKLIVNCPRDLCEFRGELRNMEEHERVCRIQTVVCPYGDIGCQERQLINYEINSHLMDGNESHARLLMECIGVLQNEMGSMKRDLADLRLERDEQKRLLEQEIQVVKEENNFLKLEMERIRTEYLELSETQSRKMRQFEDKYHRSKIRLSEVERQQAGSEKAVLRSNIDELEMRVWELGINAGTCESGQFVWRIDNYTAWSESTRVGGGKWIFSDAFYSHKSGYKMCLSAFPRRDYLCVNCHLMRGPFDGHLSWPFRGTLTLSVIDQETRLDYASRTIASDRCGPDAGEWMEPTSEISGLAISSDALIHLDVLACTLELCKGDRVFIRCVTKPESLECKISGSELLPLAIAGILLLLNYLI